MKLGCLNERAVMSKGWRWMPGMLTMDGVRIYAVEGEFFDGFDDDSEYNEHPVAALEWPDLTDPATRGCLLALVREAWRCPTVYVRQSSCRRASDGVLAWEVCDLWLDAEACKALGIPREGSVGSWGYSTEAEALVGALEAAP